MYITTSRHLLMELKATTFGIYLEFWKLQYMVTFVNKERRTFLLQCYCLIKNPCQKHHVSPSCVLSQIAFERQQKKSQYLNLYMKMLITLLLQSSTVLLVFSCPFPSDSTLSIPVGRIFHQSIFNGQPGYFQQLLPFFFPNNWKSLLFFGKRLMKRHVSSPSASVANVMHK